MTLIMRKYKIFCFFLKLYFLMIQYKLLMTQFSLSSNHWIQNAPLNPLPTTLLCLTILFFSPLSPMYICMAILKAWLLMVTLALAASELDVDEIEQWWSGTWMGWWGSALVGKRRWWWSRRWVCELWGSQEGQGSMQLPGAFLLQLPEEGQSQSL